MKYTALTPIKHDGKDYAAGDVIPVDGKAAEGLLAIGAIGDDGGKSKAKDSDGADGAKAAK